MLDLVVLPTSYLPNIQYFTKLLLGSKVLIEANETYPKQTYRNRCEILGANGRLALSIPVKRVQGNHTPTSLIEIDNSTLWQNNHWRAIESAYRTSAYFDFIADILQPFYSKRYSNLLEFNSLLLNALIEFLGVDLSVSLTTDFVENYSDALCDCRTSINPKKSYSNDLIFNPKEYFQVFMSKYGFVPNLSIIDLIFNEGLDSPQVIRQSINC